MSAVEADGLVYLAVNVVNVFIAGFFVERVDILGNDGNFGRIFVLQAGNRQMRRIGFGFLDFEFEVVVKVVYQCRIAPKTFDGGDVFDPMIVPQAVGTAERGQSGFRGDAGAGQNDDVFVLFVHEIQSLTDLTLMQTISALVPRRSCGPQLPAPELTTVWVSPICLCP